MARQQQIDKDSLTEAGLPDNRPVAYAEWSGGEDGGLEYGSHLKGFKVFFRCYDRDMVYSWIMGQWHPGGHPKSSQLVLVCPWCSQQLRIPGSTKTFEFEILDNPFALMIHELSDDEDATQVVKLAIKENLGCPSCLRFFRLTDNTLHKVGSKTGGVA